MISNETEDLYSIGGDKLTKKFKDYIWEHGRLSEGKAVIFRSGKLKSRFLIAASTPYYDVKAKCHRKQKVWLHRVIMQILTKMLFKDIGRFLNRM